MEKPLRNKRVSITTYLMNILLLIHLSLIQVSVYDLSDPFLYIQVPLVLLLVSLFGTYVHGLYYMVRYEKKPHIYAASISSAFSVYTIVLIILLIPSFSFDYFYIYFSILLIVVGLFNIYNIFERERYKHKSKVRIPLTFVLVVALFIYTFYTISAVQPSLA